MKMMKKLLTTGVALASIFTFGVSSVFAAENFDYTNGLFDSGQATIPSSTHLHYEYLMDNDLGTGVGINANGSLTVTFTEPVKATGYYIYTDLGGYQPTVEVLNSDGQLIGTQFTLDLEREEEIASIVFTNTNSLKKLAFVNEIELFNKNPQTGDSTNSEPAKEEEVTFGLLSSGLELTTSPITTFGDVQLQSAPQMYSTSFEGFYNVKDLRGTQEGWRLDVSATPFQVVEPVDGFANGTLAHQLPVGSLTLSPIESIAAVGQSSGALPTSELSNNTIVDDGVITVAKADVGTGMGEFNLTFPSNALSLVIDASTAKIDMVNYPDGKTPYESVLTWDLVSAP